MKSILLTLLEKNASGEGLTAEEKEAARLLISKAKPTNEPCWLCNTCGSDIDNNTIYDLDICRGHAYYALAQESRK